MNQDINFITSPISSPPLHPHSPPKSSHNSNSESESRPYSGSTNKAPLHLSPPPSPTKSSGNLLKRTTSPPTLTFATATAQFHELTPEDPPLVSDLVADDSDMTHLDAIGSNLPLPSVSNSVNKVNYGMHRCVPLPSPSSGRPSSSESTDRTAVPSAKSSEEFTDPVDTFIEQLFGHTQPQEQSKKRSLPNSNEDHSEAIIKLEEGPVAPAKQDGPSNEDGLAQYQSPKRARSSSPGSDPLENIYKREVSQTMSFDEWEKRFGGGKRGNYRDSDSDSDLNSISTLETVDGHPERAFGHPSWEGSDTKKNRKTDPYSQAYPSSSFTATSNPSNPAPPPLHQGWNQNGIQHSVWKQPSNEEQEDLNMALAISASLNSRTSTSVFSDKDLQIAEDASLAQALAESTRLVSHLSSTSKSPATLALKSELGAFTLSWYKELGKVPRWDIIKDLLGEEVGGNGGLGEGGGWVRGAGWEVRKGELELCELDEGEFRFKGSESTDKGKAKENSTEEEKKGKVDYLNTLFTYLALVKVSETETRTGTSTSSSTIWNATNLTASNWSHANNASTGTSSSNHVPNLPSTTTPTLRSISRENALKVIARLNPNNAFGYPDPDSSRNHGDDTWLEEQCRMWCRRMGEELGLWEEAKRRAAKGGGGGGGDELGEKIAEGELENMVWDGVQEVAEEEEEAEEDNQWDICHSESESEAGTVIGTDDDWDRLSTMSGSVQMSEEGELVDEVDAKETEEILKAEKEEEKEPEPKEKIKAKTRFESAVERSHPPPTLTPPLAAIKITTLPFIKRPFPTNLSGDRVFQAVSVLYPTFSPVQVRSIVCDTLDIILHLAPDDRPVFFQQYFSITTKLHLGTDEVVYALNEKDYVKKMRKEGTWPTKVELSIVGLRFHFDPVIFKAEPIHGKTVARERLVDKDGLLGAHRKPIAFFQLGEAGPYETEPNRVEFFIGSSPQSQETIKSVFDRLKVEVGLTEKGDEEKLRVFEVVGGGDDDGDGKKMEVEVPAPQVANSEFVWV